MFADEAADHRLFGVDNAYVVRDAVVLAGLMGDGNAIACRKNGSLPLSRWSFRISSICALASAETTSPWYSFSSSSPHFARRNAVFNAPRSRLAVKEQTAKDRSFRSQARGLSDSRSPCRHGG